MTTQPIVLLIGFEPFGGEVVNPSQAIIDRLDGESLCRHRIVSRLLPVCFADTYPLLRGWIDELQPALVVALGQAGGRCELSLERIAINIIDARIADNAGDQPVDVAVIDDAAPAHFATLPLKRVLQALQGAGIPVAISNSAGTFVCNQVFFIIADELCRRGEGRCGFIHVPWLAMQAAGHPGRPSMDLQMMVDGIRLALTTALEHDDDVAIASGTTH